MKKSLFIVFALMQTILCSAQIDKILGDWTTVDDKTGQSYSTVNIYRGSDGKYYGKITEMLIPGTENQKCIDCEVASGCAWCQGENYDAAHTHTVFERSTAICLMHKARVRANNYYWNKLYRKLELNNK